MGGKAAMQELVNIDLTMKAMVLSGYSDDEATCDHERYCSRRRRQNQMISVN